MNRNLLLTIGVALASMLAGAGLYNFVQEESAQTAESLPIDLQAIPMTAISGRESQLGEHRREILIVNFWAPWCAPCRREIPSLIEIQTQYAERDVEVLGLAFDGVEQVSRFVEEYQINYPIFVTGSRSGMYNVAFDNPSGALPYTALLDRNLNILYQHNGELSAEQLRQQLEQLL